MPYNLEWREYKIIYIVDSSIVSLFFFNEINHLFGHVKLTTQSTLNLDQT